MRVPVSPFQHMFCTFRVLVLLRGLRHYYDVGPYYYAFAQSTISSKSVRSDRDSTEMIDLKSSPWATWPLVIGIAIPIIGLTILFMLGLTSYLRQRRQDRDRDRDRDRDLNTGHSHHQKSNNVERSSQSSGSSSSQPTTSVQSKLMSPKPVRPLRPQMSTEECLRAISKKRLETIRESTRSSLDHQTPQTLSTSPSVAVDIAKGSAGCVLDAKGLPKGGQPANLLRANHGQGRYIRPESKTMSSLQPQEVFRPRPPLRPEFAFELDHLNPPSRLQDRA
nr:hypothetical protein CFP56_54370 [Quercus suber]